MLLCFDVESRTSPCLNAGVLLLNQFLCLFSGVKVFALDDFLTVVIYFAETPEA